MGAKSVTSSSKTDSAPPAAAAPARHAKTLGKADRARLQALSPQERFNGKDGRSGHTVTPHSYYTILPPKCGLGAAHFAVGYIIDRTFGSPGKHEWALINCVQLARLAGNDYTARAFSQALDEMAKSGVVKRKRPGCKECDEGMCECVGRTWVYKTYPEEWALLPDRARPESTPDKEEEEDDEDENGESDPDASSSASISPSAAPHIERLVQPGATGKQVVLSIQLKDIPLPMDMRMQSTNYSPWPLLFKYAVSAHGIIRELIYADPAWRTNGEVQRTGDRLAQGAAENSADPTRRIKSETQRTADRLAQTAVENKRVPRPAEFRSAVVEILRREWGKTLDETFFARIIKAAGPSLPADEFAAYANRDLQYKKNRIGEGSNSRTKHPSGILISYASQAARSWAEKADERQVSERAEKAHQAVVAAAAPAIEAELKRAEDEERAARERGDCMSCNATGRWMGGKQKCPKCGGTGRVLAKTEVSHG